MIGKRTSSLGGPLLAVGGLAAVRPGRALDCATWGFAGWLAPAWYGWREHVLGR